MPRRTAIAAPLLALALLFAAGAARAELVVLTDGRAVKVKAYEAAGEQVRLTLAFGGRMTLPIERVERVVDDEVEEPSPEPVPAAEALALAAIELRFDEATAEVPEGAYGGLIFEAAKRHGVNPRLVAAMIRQESAGNVRAVSHKGARGLMQLMPATARRFGVPKESLFDPERNLEAGTRYLRWLIDHFEGDLLKVLAGYNAGEGAVARYGGVPPYRETRGYVRRIYSMLGMTVSNL
jgi:hypothetical protein